MLQQQRYPNEQYANLGGGHYSTLDSCSQLLERTYLRPSKICQPESKYEAKPERTDQSSDEIHDRNAADTEIPSGVVDEMKGTSTPLPGEGTRQMDDEKSSRQHGGDDMDVGKSIAIEIADSENNTICDRNTVPVQGHFSPKNRFRQTNATEEPKNNHENCAPKVETQSSNGPLDCCKSDNKPSDDVLPSEDCNATKGSNLRLPGFHQAFGSTEIGRFVRPTDFAEQIVSPTTETPVVFVSTSCRRLKTTSTTSMAGGGGATNVVTVNAGRAEVISKVAKGRSRCGKRIKAVPAAPFSQAAHFATLSSSPSPDTGRNKRWIYGPESSDPSATFSPAYSVPDHKRRDSREMTHDQPMANSRVGVDNRSAACYYNGDEYNYHTSMAHYGGSAYAVGDDGGGGGGGGGGGDYGGNYNGNGSGGRVGDGYDYSDYGYYRCQQSTPYQNCVSSTRDLLTSRSNYANCNSFYCANERSYRNPYLSSSSSSLSPSPSPSSFSSCSSSSSLSSSSSSSSSSSPSSLSSSPSSLYSSSSLLPTLSPYHSNHHWRSERYLPYNELNGYGAYRQQQPPSSPANSSPYAYHHQHYVAQNQNSLTPQSFGAVTNYGYNSYHQTVPDYNYY